MDFRIPDYVVHQQFDALSAGERLPWHLTKFAVPALWNTTEGKGVKVGIVDTGIDPKHAEEGDLKGRVAAARDFTGSRYGYADRNGHGTHVAGIVAAVRNNDLGIVGVAPQATLYAAKGLGDNGSGSDGQIVNAIDWLVAERCHIINMSLGSNQRSQAIIAAVDRAVEAGITVICAAGNAGDGVTSWPANHERCISVAAINEEGRPSKFSSPSSVDVAAPGERIDSCYLDGTYATLSGTSMAAPYVAGMVALILSAHAAGDKRVLTPTEVLALLVKHAVDIGSSGPDLKTGAGLFDADSYLKTLLAPPAPAVPNVPGVTLFIPGATVIAVR